MSNSQTLRRQHGEATAMIERLLDAARRYRGEQDAKSLALQLSRLASLLRLHFVQEDCTLYAPLLDSRDRKVARVASDYFEDFHRLAERIDLFAFRWCSAGGIGAEFGRFREELSVLCELLTQRIALEEAYLYPLLESQRSTSRRAA